MCGIAAIINPLNNGEMQMEYMLSKISHRGDIPPVQLRFGNSILGSVRLRIVDIPNGTQPVFNETGTIGVIYNGEIYNYKALKSELEHKGHFFKSDCDTEVLVHLYEEFGPLFLKKLEGMFAFLIYDAVNDCFLGARDFFGVKPFYYCSHGDAIYISSEMKSFDGIDTDEYKELKPGHYFTNEGVQQYYKIPTTEWHTGDTEKITLQVRELVENAVQKRVQTDLPIATFLSGGIDSSIVHLLCCKYHNNVTGLIIGDESSEDVIFAKRLCQDKELKYIHINVNKKDLLQDLPGIVYSTETFEPNPIRGSLLSRKLSEVAHQNGFKIVLCGEGSDEIFGGYGDFLFLSNESDFQDKIHLLLRDLYRTQLLRIDRTGMQHGVEVREPFLDRALVEYTLRVHPSLKVADNSKNKLTTKYVLREAFKDLLPSYTYEREKMTLMKGAGIGGVGKRDGILYDYTAENLSDHEWHQLKTTYPEYALNDKEEGVCFKLFKETFLKASFARSRVVNAQKEIA